MRLIDISAPLKAGIASDPPEMLPEIQYLEHHETAPRMAEYMGVGVDAFPDGEYAAMERCTVSTHMWTAASLQEVSSKCLIRSLAFICSACWCVHT